MSDDRRKALASVVIVLVIALHAVPVLYSAERDTLWPFMIWAMYKNSRPAGPVEVHQRHIFAITASGTRDTVTPDLLGVSITVLNQRYDRPLMNGDSTVASQVFERLNRDRADPYVRLELVSEVYTVTDTGLTRGRKPVVVYDAPEVTH